MELELYEVREELKYYFLHMNTVNKLARSYLRMERRSIVKKLYKVTSGGVRPRERSKSRWRVITC